MEEAYQFYGFRAKRSSEQAIIDLLVKILHVLNTKKQNSIIY